MIEPDTIRLLRECDAGVRMGVASIGDVLSHVEDPGFYKKLNDCKNQHDKLADEIQQLLDKYEDQGKAPNPIALGMSRAKTNLMLGWKDTDKTVADLMTSGCDMGVKSLNRYLNQYQAADAVSKDIAKRLIKLEEQLTTDIRQYL